MTSKATHRVSLMTDAEPHLNDVAADSRRVAIINGVLCLTGILVASIAYFWFPHPDVVRHVIVRFGVHERTESIISYLFFFSIVQIWLFAVLAMAAWWPAFRSVDFGSRKTIAHWFPRIQPPPESDLPHILTITGFFFVTMSGFCLIATLYHSVLIALGKV